MKGLCNNNGCKVVDGDILVANVQSKRRDANNDIKNPKMWADGIIKYSFAPLPEIISGNKFTLLLREAKRRIVANMHTLSMLTFEEVPEVEAELLFVSPKNERCSATVGAPVAQGVAAEVHLGYAKHCWTDRIILHELLHVAGMYHEQSRLDRDQYLHVGTVVDAVNNGIVWNNPLPFDFLSIMLYPLKYIGESGASPTSKGTNRMNVQNVKETDVGSTSSLSHLNWDLLQLWYGESERAPTAAAQSNNVEPYAVIAVACSVLAFVLVVWALRSRKEKVAPKSFSSF